MLFGAAIEPLGLPNEKVFDGFTSGTFVYAAEAVPGIGVSVFKGDEGLILRAFRLDGKDVQTTYCFLRDNGVLHRDAVLGVAHSPLEAKCKLYAMANAIAHPLPPTHVTTGGNNHAADPGV